MDAALARQIEEHNDRSMHDQFDQLRQTIDKLEKQSEQGAQRAGGTAPRGTRQRSRKGQPSMSTTQPTAAAPGVTGGNLPKFQELLATAEELGGQEAQGKDVQIKW